MKLSKQVVIGETLIARGAITRSQLDMAMKFHEPARRLGKALLADGVISSDDLDKALGWLLAEAIVGLGYAGEKEVFGSLRVSVAPKNDSTAEDEEDMDHHDDEDMENLPDF